MFMEYQIFCKISLNEVLGIVLVNLNFKAFNFVYKKIRHKNLMTSQYS